MYQRFSRYPWLPVIRLKRAVAVVMQRPRAGDLADYQWMHSTKGDLYRWLGWIPEALEAYGKALEMSRLEPDCGGAFRN